MEDLDPNAGTLLVGAMEQTHISSSPRRGTRAVPFQMTSQSASDPGSSESEDADDELLPSSEAEQQRPASVGSNGGLRHRMRGSRSSRPNSLSSVVTPSPGGSTSSEAEDTASQSSSQVIKRRKKRKRHVGEYEKLMATKGAQIEKAMTLADGMAGLEQLRALAISEGGLLNDDLRKRAWPKLQNIHMIETAMLPSQAECEKHGEYQQVVLDVNRSLKRFPPGIQEDLRPGLQDQLTRLIVRVLLKHSDLHYFQGYHDVAITFLLVVGEDMGYHIMERLSRSHLREFMAPTMERTTLLLNYMYPLIQRVNPDLYDFLESSEVGTIFALPWVITWFGHVLPDYEDVVRLYDFFLAMPPLMPVYLATTLVLHRTQEILLCECDLAAVHSLLSRIPVNLPFEHLLIEAQMLYEKYPPKTVDYQAKARFAALQRQLRAPRGRYRALDEDAWKGYVAGGVLVAAPVLAGLFAWKYFNSS